MKPTTPFGGVPVLKLQDGTQLAQAKAILRFLGQMHGYYPQNPLDSCKVDGLIDHFEDAWSAIWKAYHVKDETRDEVFRKFYEETLPKAMKEVEPIIGDGWLVGSKLSTADFYIGGFYTNVITHAPYSEHKAMKDKFVSDHPKFAAYGKRFLKENENWVKNRPVAPL